MGSDDIKESIFLLLEGKSVPEEEEELKAWLAEGEEHRRIFEEICRTYYDIRYSSSWNKIDAVAAVQRMGVRIARKRELRRWSLWGIGAAAVVLLCLGVLNILRPVEVGDLPSLVRLEDVQSGEKRAMLTLADGQQVPLSVGREVKVELGFAQAVEDSVVGLVYRFKDSVEIPLEYHTISVPRAGEYIMTLSDGSRVWLNAETEMKYPVVFAADKREVYVHGEAFFEVVKDERRPFVVHTACTRTTVLGTSFNVMDYEDSEETEVTLVSGRVEVDAGGTVCRILPGQQVAVDRRSMRMRSREVNVDFYTSWKRGLFDFDGMSLQDLCVQLSRWYDVDFFFVDPSAGKKRFTGAVKRNNTLRFMLDFVEKTSNVRFEIKDKVISVYDSDMR